MMYGLYGALLRLAWAVVLPYQFVIALLTGADLPRLGERLGRLPSTARARPGGIWIHAVSVGEVRLALALAARLRAVLPDCPIHLTTVTATGRGIAETARSGSDPARPDTLSEFPFDFAGSMGRLLDGLQPRAVLIVETEIWPNLLRSAQRREIPVALINGRVSPRAFPRYRAIRRFLNLPLSRIRLFAMQSDEDAERIRALGAPEARIRVTGNLKFDLPIAEADGPSARRLLRIDDATTLFVAGSTGPGEESPVLHAFAALRREVQDSRLVLAPRHPRDLPRAESALSGAGLRIARWSEISHDVATPAEYDALLVDVVGVLPQIYAAATVVFVGGSLIRRGGHNVLEPAALGKPVLFGPHMENFQAASRALIDGGAGFVARDAHDLATLVVRLIADRAAYRVAATMARRVVQSNRGAMDRTIALLLDDLNLSRARVERRMAQTSC